MSYYGRLARDLRRQRQARKLRRKALDALDASAMVFARSTEQLPRGRPEKGEQKQYVPLEQVEQPAASSTPAAAPVRYSKDFIAQL